MGASAATQVITGVSRFVVIKAVFILVTAPAARLATPTRPSHVDALSVRGVSRVVITGVGLCPVRKGTTRAGGLAPVQVAAQPRFSSSTLAVARVGATVAAFIVILGFFGPAAIICVGGTLHGVGQGAVIETASPP